MPLGVIRNGAEVQITATPEDLAQVAAQHFLRLAGRAIATQGCFRVVLAGGETPRRLYCLLAKQGTRERIAWEQVHVFWSDERSLPPSSEESNFHMARVTLLDHVPIPSSNVHRIRGEAEAVCAAAEYEQLLRAQLGTPTGPPSTAPLHRFDLVLLGMGNDGHTASLFPGSVLLREQQSWVVAPRAEIAAVQRITLTPVILNAAAEIVFLVSGSSKARMLQQVLEDPIQLHPLPAQAICPRDGRLTWLLDAAAAKHLAKPNTGS